MNEEFNPYEKRQTEEQPYDSYSQPQDYQPQVHYPPQQDYQYQEQQDYYRQPDQYNRQIYYPYQNQPTSQPNGGKAAKIFSIISFAAGCFSMLRASLLVFFELAMSGCMLRGIDLSISYVFSIMSVAVPGLVFGIIALIKRTKMIPMAMLGAIFNGTVIVTVLTLYFFYYLFR